MLESRKTPVALEDPKVKSLEQVKHIRNKVKRRVIKLVEEVSNVQSKGNETRCGEVPGQRS